MLEMTWTPDREEGQRQMILFNVDGAIRFQAFLIGRAKLPQRRRKVGTTFVGEFPVFSVFTNLISRPTNCFVDLNKMNQWIAGQTACTLCWCDKLSRTTDHFVQPNSSTEAI